MEPLSAWLRALGYLGWLLGCIALIATVPVAFTPGPKWWWVALAALLVLGAPVLTAIWLQPAGPREVLRWMVVRTVKVLLVTLLLLGLAVVVVVIAVLAEMHVLPTWLAVLLALPPGLALVLILGHILTRQGGGFWIGPCP